MKNEFGEEISESEIEELGGRISVLSPEKIDELFYRIGFIVEKSGRGETPEPEYNALHSSQIKEVQENGGDSAILRNLLRESRISSVRTILSKVEEET